jgi:hypothetical protein
MSTAARSAQMRHDPGKARPWHKLHDLREHRLAGIHKQSSEKSISESYSNMKALISNRHQYNLLENPRQSLISAHSLLI